MAPDKLQLGIIGLGRMGGDLALQAVDKGMFVVGHSKHRHPAFERQGVSTVDNYQDFARKHPSYPYIVINDRPKVAALQKRFPNVFKA
jgi:6-phosphogluconate dehydrogenase (decarboxylating)